MNIKNAVTGATFFFSLFLCQLATAEITLQEAKEKIAQLEGENQSLKEQITDFEQEIAEVREKIDNHEVNNLKNTETTD